MKARHIFAIIGVVVGVVAASGVALRGDVRATGGYDEGIKLDFQVDEVLTVDLSSTALTIEELIPGTSAVSNYITLTTQTNNMSGCVLLADVGDGKTYTSTDLIGNGSTFTSLASNAEIATLSDNTWGYSASYDSGATWTSYSGLPLYGSSSKKLTAVSGMGADSIRFRIAAKASDAQTSGEYRNVINFSVVSQVNPLYMQDAAEWIDSYAVGQQFVVLDKRDNQSYRVAKLSESELWMTTNLNLAGGTTVTSENSNVTADYTLPAAPTVANNTGYPTSYTGIVNTPYTSCASNRLCFSYYTYDIATAGSVEGQVTGSATSDICPKNWRMLTKDEYATLTTQYNTAAKLEGSPIKLVYNGMINTALERPGAGTYADVWTATMTNATDASMLYIPNNFSTSSPSAFSDQTRTTMAAVRCKYIGATN